MSAKNISFLWSCKCTGKNVASVIFSPIHPGVKVEFEIMKNYQENKVKLDLELLTRLSAACETVLSGLLEKAKASDPGPARLIVLEMHLIFGMYEHMFKKQCSPDVKKQCSKLYSASSLKFHLFIAKGLISIEDYEEALPHVNSVDELKKVEVNTSVGIEVIAELRQAIRSGLSRRSQCLGEKAMSLYPQIYRNLDQKDMDALIAEITDYESELKRIHDLF